MIASLIRQARAHRGPAVILTFDPHPITLLRPGQAPPSLSTLGRKAELLEACGVDCVIAYPTDRALLNLTPEEFFDEIVCREMEARGLVEGPNFFFGRDRAGDVDRLKHLCDRAGLSLEIVPPHMVGNTMVSSSRTRQHIAQGAMAEAVELLGHPYRIRGRVVSGAGRGRDLGFPTANLEDIATLLPPAGVYVGVCCWREQVYAAAVHHGPNPTFQEPEQKLEVHLIDFVGDLHGAELDVDLLERIRELHTFDTIDALRTQLSIDIEKARHVAKKFVSS